MKYTANNNEDIQPETNTEATVNSEQKKDEFENPRTGIMISGSIIIGGVITILAIRLITKKNKLYNL